MSEFQAKAGSDIKSVTDDAINHDAGDKLSARAPDFYETVADAGKKSVSALSAQTQQRPLTSLVIAFAAGFVLGKILTR